MRKTNIILEISGEENLEPGGSRMGDVTDFFNDAKSCLASNADGKTLFSALEAAPSDAAAGVPVKTEIKAEGKSPSPSNSKQVEALVKDTRKVFLACSEAITILKTHY